MLQLQSPNATVFIYLASRLLVRSAPTTFHTVGVDDFTSILFSFKERCNL
jgi:hypothetical protein